MICVLHTMLIALNRTVKINVKNKQEIKNKQIETKQNKTNAIMNKNRTKIKQK